MRAYCKTHKVRMNRIDTIGAKARKRELRDDDRLWSGATSLKRVRTGRLSTANARNAVSCCLGPAFVPRIMVCSKRGSWGRCWVSWISRLKPPPPNPEDARQLRQRRSLTNEAMDDSRKRRAKLGRMLTAGSAL
ncbi:hypothetical protein B0H67DRAFT_198061 [Lasiosphaeris hirsuta]|uniref:Uncharacterized protein n=1 Tax=Lasiosphaeris hirsuta TaxID=260670 RepID=A0AA40E1B9_9PEZI|nr:hypothetical protein B0H67DRAFT_198061 [Lasiosphaeris hirsuta]